MFAPSAAALLALCLAGPPYEVRATCLPVDEVAVADPYLVDLKTPDGWRYIGAVWESEDEGWWAGFPGPRASRKTGTVRGAIWLLILNREGRLEPQ